MRFLRLLKQAVCPALLAFALILFRSGAAQAEIVVGVPALAEALAEADVIVSGELRPVVPLELNSPGAPVYRFTFEPQRVLRGQPAAALALTRFEKRGFSWPRDLAPFESGVRCILLIKNDAAHTLIGVLPALATSPANGETSTLKPLLTEVVFQRLMKSTDPSSGGRLLSLYVVAEELSVSQLEALRSTHPKSAAEIDEILDRRLDAEVMRLADAGAFEEAEKLIAGFRSEELRSQGVARLVNAHIYKREYDTALMLIPRLSPYDRISFLETIARYLERTRPADANAAAEAMLKAFGETPVGLRYNGQAGIVATYLARHGREEEARALLSKGVELAPANAATLAADQVRLGFIADALVSIGRLDPPNQIIRLAREAETLARSGQKDAANDFLTRARTVALSVDKSNRARYVEDIEKAQTLVNSAR